MVAFQIQPWTFAQLNGAQTILTLAGAQAPFGRPRQGTIVNAGLSIRRSVTYYPDTGNGGATQPTVHAFGTEPKPFELHGIWIDSRIGTVGAVRQMQRQWSDFIAAKQLVRAKWGDILSYIIFVHDVDLNYESSAHMTWKLTADVIQDEQAPTPTYTPPPTSPSDYANQLSALLSKPTFQAPVPFNLAAMLGELQDDIANTIATLNTPFQMIYAAASAISDFETALSTDLVAMASGLQTLKTAAANLQDATTVAMANAAILNTETVDLPNGVFSAPDVTSMRAQKIQQDADMANLQSLIADMLQAIALAQRGTTASSYLGQLGDTWESIGVKIFGDPSAAAAIRDLNAIKYGQRVQAGKVYQLPAKA